MNPFNIIENINKLILIGFGCIYHLISKEMSLSLFYPKYVYVR